MRASKRKQSHATFVSYLLDTCVLSELVKSSPNPDVLHWIGRRNAGELHTSAVTWAELARGVARLPSSRRKSDLEKWLNNLEVAFEGRILPFDAQAAEAWAQLTVRAEAGGKSIAAFDSLIVATAMRHALKLVTRNVRDFVSANIDLLNPWDER